VSSSRLLAFVWFAQVAACSSAADAGVGDVGDAASDVVADAIVDAPADVPADSPADASVDGDVGGALPLDCKFVRDPSNCWRTFVASIDTCLGNVSPPGGDRGTLSTDRMTCSYGTGGRSVAFAIGLTDATEAADRDFVVSTPKTSPCLHYTERATSGGFVATGPTGTVEWITVGNDVTLVCPDGSRFHGDALAITKLCAADVIAGGAPSRRVTNASGALGFQLVGMVDFAYDCLTSP
jgi:hypothetical protein